MGRAPCCDKTKVKRGPWSPEEDTTLRNYVEKYGTGGNWIALPHKAGLKRCGKSCRLRWLNYLRPDIKHGGFTEEEDNIILTLFTNIGSRWSVIASHLPGRTDNDVKNYWNTKLRKKLISGAGVVNAKNPSATIPITSGNSDNISLATSLTPFNQVQAICYGNSTYHPVCYESSDILPYSMDVNQGYPEVDPDMFYQSATDQFPLPGLMEVQENGTPQNGFSTSSSQEFSCLSPSHALAKSYASWNDNEVGEEVGFFMDLEPKSSNYDFDQKIQQGKTVSAEVNHSSLVACSYPAGSLMASISDSDKAQGLHQSISN